MTGSTGCFEDAQYRVLNFCLRLRCPSVAQLNKFLTRSFLCSLFNIISFAGVMLDLFIVPNERWVIGSNSRIESISSEKVQFLRAFRLYAEKIYNPAPYCELSSALDNILAHIAEPHKRFDR